jgi:hypothetical protein
MVVRYYCRCLTCGHPHTLRIAMGHGPTQQHTFQCGGCSQDMTIDVIQRPESTSCDITCSMNCEAGTEEGLIVNLHPDFPIPEDQLHVDRVFPWLAHVARVGKRQEELGHASPAFSSLEDLKAQYSQIQTYPVRWAIVRKAWSLARSGQSALAAQELAKYQLRQANSNPRLEDVLFDFCAGLLQSKAPLFVDARALLELVFAQSPNEVQQLAKWYREHWGQDHLERYFDIFSEYFKDFGEFSQSLLLCQYGLPIGEDEVASSQTFSRTKMFYGNAFEALMSNVEILACINNIQSGRPFDQFASMNLKKYVTINKARRAEPFAATPALAALATGINSTVRNPSHHGAIRLDQSSGMITYRSGGTGATQRMRYIEYLTLCSEMLLQLAALLMLELTLAQQ